METPFATFDSVLYMDFKFLQRHAKSSQFEAQ